MKKKGRIVILSGPSGSGKTTLYKKIITRPKLRRVLVRSISATTRPCRSGEKAGRDYLFLTQKEFLSRRKKGDFLEWQKVFLYYYGTPRESVEALLRKGKNVLLAIDVKGARVVWQKYPKALKIFIKTPSLRILKERLVGRGTEKKQDLNVRFQTAKKELKEAKKYDYVLVNNNLNRCSRQLERILIQKLCSPLGVGVKRGG